MTVLSRNLKRLRMEKHLTQEQAAELLGVSTQSVSRWECATTLPDVMLLPKIAETYCVTIDDLYKETSTAYDNYAQRLGSIYEATLEPVDFVRADQEYKKLLSSGNYSMEDLRLYGILHQHMMFYCIKQTSALFDQALERGEAEDPETYWRTKRQKLFFLHEIGRDDENIDVYKASVAQSGEDVNPWLCLIMAYDFAGEHQDAYDTFCIAEKKFPGNGMLYCFGGDLYAGRKEYEKAFAYWNRALALDPELTDAMYAKGECYEEMGQFRKAYETYTALADHLAARGYDSEVQYPRELAKRCRDKLK